MARKKTAQRKSTSTRGAKKTAKRAAPKRSAAKRPAKPTNKRPAAKPAKKAAPKKPSKPAAPRPEAPPPVPNAMGLASSHMDFISHNLDEVKRFYTQQLGFTRFEHDPSFNYLFVQTTGNSSLGFMPPMPGGGLPTPPREPTLYFIVKDIDEAYRKLQARGVSFESPPEDMPWGHRVVRTRDPEGRSIMMAQAMKK